MAEAIKKHRLLFAGRHLLNRDDCLRSLFILVLTSTTTHRPPNMSAEPTEQDVQSGFDEKLRQRKAQLENHPLNTVPKAKAHQPEGVLPNTPLTASTISFALGWAFSLGVLTFLRGGFGSWWNSYQLGFFVAAWSGFHWGEFAVTAGWNLEKCSVDCAYTLLPLLCSLDAEIP